MSSIPSNLGRVPDLLSSQVSMAGLARTNLSLLQIQHQMSTGKRVNRVSEDAVKASAIAVLDDRLERAEQWLGNLQSASGALGMLDDAVGEAADLALEARTVAMSQIGAGSDATTRANQAVVIDSMLRQLFDLSNRKRNGLHLFGGSTPGTAPVIEAAGGYRYVGRGAGLLADLGTADDIPITIGGDNAVGQISARLRSTADLNPALTGATRLADLRGARGLGIAPGPIAISFAGGPLVEVDLGGVQTVQQLAERLTGALRQYELDQGVTILGPGGVGFSGGTLTIDVAAGGPPAPVLSFSEVGSGTSAQDLGLAGVSFQAGSPAGNDVNPRLTWQTPLSSLPGLTLPPGTVRVRFTSAGGSAVIDVDLSGAQTLDDVRGRIESAAPGVRVELSASGNGLDVSSEIAGPALSIESPPGGPDTAGELGILSLSAQTRLADFNDGRGVRVVHGVADPLTGLPTPALNADFRINLGDGSGFDVDLRPQDLVNVQALLDRINTQAAAAAAAGQIPAGALVAELNRSPAGLVLRDTGGLGALSIEKLNNSAAAEDLGLAGGSWEAGGAAFVAQDRAGVRVNNLFTALLDLAQALRTNDSDGITLAAAALQENADRLAGTRALVGVYSNRVAQATTRQEDLKLLDLTARGDLQDLDYAAASIRFSQLQTQLLAGMQTAAQAHSRSLLDFLG
ncbi:MAG TPA: flagellin [Phycisphaerales bacterium]|nr:flagellin [Phycisphaerales bacterium]